MASALAWKNLSAGYGETVVLENIDLTIAAGESVSIIGRNGVGKTTLLVTAMGHTDADERRRSARRRRDHPAADLSARARRASAWSRRSARFSPRYRCAKISRSPRAPATGTNERIFELFPRLRERLGNMGNQLSGGEQQMLAIARALLTNPQFC